MIGCEDRLRNDLYCVEWGVNILFLVVALSVRRCVLMDSGRMSGPADECRRGGALLGRPERRGGHLPASAAPRRRRPGTRSDAGSRRVVAARLQRPRLARLHRQLLGRRR